MQNSHKCVVPISSRSWVTVPALLQGVKNAVIQSEGLKMHSEIRYCVMPPPGGALENICMGAQAHSCQYAMASKVGLKLYILQRFWCTQTYHHQKLFSTIAWM